MSFSFNLIDQPWIPCVKKNGQRVDLSLYDTLTQSHNLREVRGDTPLETAALHRLLLAVLHRAFLGPKDRKTWAKMWNSFDIKPIEDYLTRQEIYSRFDLFHPDRPFFQSLDPCAGKKSVISLVLQMASGNNATLFDHHTEVIGASLTPAQAARALIVSQSFGFGGLSGLPEKFVDAPCSKNIIFLAVGQNVLETLLLNFVRYSENTPIPSPENDDVPAWEMEDPYLPDRNRPKGYLDYLTWHNRRIWLYPEQTENGVIVKEMSWAPGLRLKVYDDIDPMSQYIFDKKEGVQVLRFHADRALWRDSAVLCRLGDNAKPSFIVRWLTDLASIKPKVIDKAMKYRFIALGMAKNRASVDFLRAEILPLPIDLITNENRVSDLSTALELSEKASKLLNRCGFLLAWLIFTPATLDSKFDDSEKDFDQQVLIDSKTAAGKNIKSKDHEAQKIYKLFSSFGIERLYWSSLEPYFYHFIQDLPDQPETAMHEWRRVLERTARAAFAHAQAYAGADRRSLRAVVQAEVQFERGLPRIVKVTP